MARRKGPTFYVLLLVLLAIPAAAVWWILGGNTGTSAEDIALSDPVSRGSLVVGVLEGGSLEALESHVIRSEVEGRNEIIYIVPEGTFLKQQDIDEGKVLVQLNDAGLQEKLRKQEISVTAATGARDAARNSLEIQKQTSDSDIRKARLSVRFAELDLTRYVGQDLADELLAMHARWNAAGVEGETQPRDVKTTEEQLERLVSWIKALLESERLQGEALQKRRQFTSDIRLAQEERTRAQVKLEWSTKLEAKGYVSREEFVADKLQLQRREIDLERAETALTQYATYDFPKEVERLLSELVDKRDQLERTIKKARSNLAKSTSELETKERELKLKKAEFDNYKQQLDKCVIRATEPGLVVYASSGKERRWGNDNRIQEGTAVRQRQAIIRIPKPGSLGARINVHETIVDRVRKGLGAKVTVDAMPDEELDGRVRSVSTLPNPADRWLNPDLKVYATIIELVGSHPTLKPGMSVQVSILLDELTDVLQVPVQAVAGKVGEPVVWIWRGDEAVPQPVELGLSNDRYVEVKAGLSGGERLLLDPPREDTRTEDQDKAEQPKDAEPSGPEKAGTRKERGAKPGGRPEGRRGS